MAPANPTYDPLNFSQITGGVPIPSWVFNQPVKSIEDYDQQRNQLLLQEGAVRGQEAQEQERQRTEQARTKYGEIIQRGGTLDEQMGEIQKVMAQYGDPMSAMKMSLDQRREQRQEEQNQMTLFRQLLNDNPLVAEQWAKSNGLAEREGLGGIDYGRMGGKIINTSDGVYERTPDGRLTKIISESGGSNRPNYDYVYDPITGKDRIENMNDPATRDRFNKGELQSPRSRPDEPDPFNQLFANILQQNGLSPEGTPGAAPYVPPIKDGGTGGPAAAPRPTPPPAPPQAGEKRIIGGVEYMKVPGGWAKATPIQQQ